MYKVFRELLSEKEIKYIFDTFDQATNKRWGRVYAVNFKSNVECIAQSVAPDIINQKIKDKILFAVQDTDPSREFLFFEHWSMNQYLDSERGHFYWHKDRLDGFRYANLSAEDIFIHNLKPQREMSVTVALNSRSSYNGGQFTIDAGDGSQTPLDLNAGDAVVFDSDTFHGVDDVTEGTRFALVIWLVDKEKYLQWKQLCLEQGIEIT